MGICNSSLGGAAADLGDERAFAQAFALSSESLGKGSTAEVFVAESLRPRQTGNAQKVAVKVINKGDFDESQQATILREAAILHRLNKRTSSGGSSEGGGCDSIIKSFAFYNGSPEKAFLVLELIDGGDLYDRLDRRKGTYLEFEARELM